MAAEGRALQHGMSILPTRTTLFFSSFATSVVLHRILAYIFGPAFPTFRDLPFCCSLPEFVCWTLVAVMT